MSSTLTTAEVRRAFAHGIFTIPDRVLREREDEFDRWLARVKAEAKAEGIAEFVNEQSVRYRKHSGAAIEEDIALAIGHFGVPVEEFYSDGLPLDSDYLIAQIERHRIARAELVESDYTHTYRRRPGMSAMDDELRAQAYAERGRLHHDVATCKSCWGDYKYARVCRYEQEAILAGRPEIAPTTGGGA